MDFNTPEDSDVKFACRKGGALKVSFSAPRRPLVLILGSLSLQRYARWT